ncbi:MAG TPA: hypothetical protein VKB96_10490, partial [Gammaproteobacteria bacterium]|nr:hypothetical protein [Gammaproteobacteria bacterium]
MSREHKNSIRLQQSRGCADQLHLIALHIQVGIMRLEREKTRGAMNMSPNRRFLFSRGPFCRLGADGFMT